MHPDLLRIGLHEGDQHHADQDQRRHYQPGQGDRLEANPAPDDLGDPYQYRADEQSDQRTGGDETQRHGPQPRRKHVGSRHAHLLRGIETHAENQHADNERNDPLQEHRDAHDDRAQKRQAKAQLDTGLAAIGVGDLADRIGHHEPADAEQHDRQSGEARGARERDHHQRSQAIAKLSAGAHERLRQRKQRGVAFDQPRDTARPGNRLVH